MTDSRTSELDFDPDALHRKYLEERDKRLRPEGLGQYQATAGPSSPRTGKIPTPRRTSPGSR